MKIKAIKIDVTKQDVYEVELTKGKNHLKEVYALLNVQLIEAALVLPTRDYLYVDEEAKLKPIMSLPGAFHIHHLTPLLFGHGLLVGCTPSGVETNVKFSVQELREMITFVSTDVLVRRMVLAAIKNSKP